MHIRPYAEADLGRVGWVHSRSRQSAYADLVPADALAVVTAEKQTDAWRERMSSMPDPHAMFVAEIDGLVVGFALGQVDGCGAELNAIHVLAQQHGSGIGQALLDHVVQEFREWERRTAHLWVIAGNDRAQAFYRRNGWRHDGTRSRHALGGAVVPIVRYRLEL